MMTSLTGASKRPSAPATFAVLVGRGRRLLRKSGYWPGALDLYGAWEANVSTLTDKSHGEWRNNWPVVIAGAAGGSLSTLHLYSTGVMIAPLEQEFGWSRAVISSGLTITAVVGVILAPIIGMLIDRIGPRRVGFTGAVLFCISIAALSLTRSAWTWWAAWSAVAVTATCIAPSVWAAGVSGLFDRSRGMALALTLCGTSAGAMLVPMATHLLVESYGWRNAYLGISAVWALVTIPLIFFFFTSLIDKHHAGGSISVLPGRQPGVDASVRQVITSLAFVKLALAAVAIVTVVSSLIGNLVPILTLEGHSPGSAAAIAGLLGVGSIIGRLCGGYLLDRINGSIVGGASVLVPIITCLLLLITPGSAVAASAAVLMMGMAVGVEWDAVAYLTSRHFGVHNFGTVFGTIGGLLLLMNGIGPFITNYVYDVTGSYVPALWGAIPLCLLSSTLFLTLGPYPRTT